MTERVGACEWGGIEWVRRSECVSEAFKQGMSIASFDLVG